MHRIPGVRRLLHLGSTRSSIGRDVDDEIRFHIETRVDALMAQGHSRSDADRLARDEYGDMNAARAELAAIDKRFAGRVALREWLASWAQDIRFALRSLRARPGFTLAVLLTLGLGVGANTAIFSLVDDMLLRPLPYAQPDRLYHLWETYPGSLAGRSEASYPDYLDWRARNRVFKDMAGYQGGGFLLGGNEPRTVGAGRTTSNFFDVLGVHPMLGRAFAMGEDAVGAPRVVLLTYTLWQRDFGGDPSALGRTITLDGASATIIGVLPEAFHFARLPNAELWAPIDRNAQARANRGNHWLNVIARTRPGVTQRQASEDLSRIMQALAKEYPPSNATRDGSVIPLHDELVGSVRSTLLLLYAAVVVVLLVACVNVANLLLMRGAHREREIAVRVALGAGRGRLIRQLLTESLVLAFAGCIVGLGAARLALSSLAAILPDHPMRGLPRFDIGGLDARVVVYALVTSVVTGIVFGLLPALRLTRSTLHDAIKSGTRGSGGGSMLRNSLVVAEVALTMMLASGAVLFARSLIGLLAINPGFVPEHVVTTTVVLPVAHYRESSSQSAFFQRLLDELRGMSGVQSAGVVSKLPLDFGNSFDFSILGRATPEPGRFPEASYREASTEYFRAIGVRTVAGRVFGSGDDSHSPRVAIINRALASIYFANQDPVGQAISTGNDTIRIVGVVGNVPIGNLDEKIPPTVYFPVAQSAERNMALVVRTNADLATTTALVRRAVGTIDPQVGLTQAMTMDDFIDASPSVFMRRLPLVLIGAFALTALALAFVGIHGVVTYSVVQRTREMGIRTALGAQPSSLMALVVRHGAAMAAAGIALGTIGAIAAGRLVQGLLYGVSSGDPVTYLSVACALAVATIAATLMPARRAMRIDPATALRAE